MAAKEGRLIGTMNIGDAFLIAGCPMKKSSWSWDLILTTILKKGDA